MDKTDNPYTILGVSEDSDEGAIKKAYFKLARVCHPDKQTCDADREAATSKFAKIADAYDLLQDPVRRYDWRQAHPGGSIASSSSSAGTTRKEAPKPSAGMSPKRAPKPSAGMSPRRTAKPSAGMSRPASSPVLGMTRQSGPESPGRNSTFGPKGSVRVSFGMASTVRSPASPVPPSGGKSRKSGGSVRSQVPTSGAGSVRTHNSGGAVRRRPHPANERSSVGRMSSSISHDNLSPKGPSSGRKLGGLGLKPFLGGLQSPKTTRNSLDINSEHGPRRSNVRRQPPKTRQSLDIDSEHGPRRSSTRCRPRTRNSLDVNSEHGARSSTGRKPKTRKSMDIQPERFTRSKPFSLERRPASIFAQ